METVNVICCAGLYAEPGNRPVGGVGLGEGDGLGDGDGLGALVVLLLGSATVRPSPQAAARRPSVNSASNLRVTTELSQPGAPPLRIRFRKSHSSPCGASLERHPTAV